MSPWLYATACVVVPVLWGVLVVGASNFVESQLSKRARRNDRSKGRLPPIDYHI